ncbi:hypothetical protein [Lysinibacillus sp. SGAir0095]|uniref:hypothetical protein n=1 Tax=Lysinibacillus sp. SGAir0095 TaxID=2070463 RepID=UPI0010CD4D8B|nr:hypothetical protein [Lysinibacillus sp. SGAir0095]QCR31267.1 hypothetical protein C1N55_03435 [Lysinibacillus sp. SGAir0095]
MLGLLIAFMLAFYFIVLFKNGIEPSEIVIEFSILYLCSCIIIILLIWILRKGSPKIPTIIALALVVVMIGVKSYVAIKEIPDFKINRQMELATILGNSPEYKELGINSNADIDWIKIHGAPKRGNFHQTLDYVIELRIKNDEHPYYFMCAGTGPDCEQYEQVEESLALRLIEHYQ